MNRILLTAGKYRAVTNCVVALYQGEQEREWQEFQPGESFEVGHHVNGFGKFLKHFDEFGDAEHQVERIGD